MLEFRINVKVFAFYILTLKSKGKLVLEQVRGGLGILWMNFYWLQIIALLAIRTKEKVYLK